MSFDPKNFWENKIRTWEEGRYESEDHKSGNLLEKIADRSSRSLRYRLHISPELLKPHVAGKRIVEVGCGSGLLAKRFLDMGAESFIGYDFATSAIDTAKKLAEDGGYADKAEFVAMSVSEMPPLEGDIVFSLGLLDWLTDEELTHLFKVSGQMDFLHAIAEKRSSLSQLLHRFYVHLSYGHKTGSYVPRYYQVPALKKMMMADHPSENLHVYRHPHLSFGALLCSLPVENATVE